MNQEEIMKILPHRDNMLLLEEVSREEDTARLAREILAAADTMKE